MSEERSLTRRQLLRGAGATALGGAALAGGVSPVRAEHADEQPPYVTLSYDESLIKQYQPLLVLKNVEHRPEAYHAVYVESEESDLDVVVGFHRYFTQEGVDPAGSDSHLGDREPCYVYVESSTGEPIKVQYSAYHWYSNTERWDALQTDESGMRPVMQAIPRWHHHRVYSGGLSGEELEVRNLLESYPGWLSNGLESEIHPGAVYNPLEEMQHRPYWWSDGAQNWSERTFAQLYLTLGIRGADNSDLDGGIR